MSLICQISAFYLKICKKRLYPAQKRMFVTINYHFTSYILKYPKKDALPACVESYLLTQNILKRPVVPNLYYWLKYKSKLTYTI